MSVVEFGIERGFIEQANENMYIIHPRRVLNAYVLENALAELKNEGYEIRRETVNGTPLFVAEKQKSPSLWVKPADEVPDILEDVEVIDSTGYQRKATYFVTKYGDCVFDCGEMYIPLDEVIVWRKL